jgi:hypothetical protein
MNDSPQKRTSPVPESCSEMHCTLTVLCSCIILSKPQTEKVSPKSTTPSRKQDTPTLQCSQLCIRQRTAAANTAAAVVSAHAFTSTCQTSNLGHTGQTSPKTRRHRPDLPPDPQGCLHLCLIARSLARGPEIRLRKAGAI